MEMEMKQVNEKLLSGQERPFFRKNHMGCCFTDPGASQRSGHLRDHIQRPREGALNLHLKQLRAAHKPESLVKIQHPGRRVCLEGPPEFRGASECLIANWLN